MPACARAPGAALPVSAPSSSFHATLPSLIGSKPLRLDDRERRAQLAHDRFQPAAYSRAMACGQLGILLGGPWPLRVSAFLLLSAHMQQRSVVWVGSSHVGAVSAAAQAAQSAVAVVNFKRVPNFAEDIDRGLLAPSVVQKLGGRTVISLVGGNMHNEMGLIRHPRPFDFVLPAEPELPTDDGELIPAEALEAALRRRMRRALAALALLKQHATERMYHLESPPPIGDDDYIRQNIDPFYQKRGVAELGIVSRGLRYKLWRLHSEIVRRACSELAIDFVPCPREAIDDGFLRRDLYANATHANHLYGAMLLAQVESL